MAEWGACAASWTGRKPVTAPQPPAREGHRDTVTQTDPTLRDTGPDTQWSSQHTETQSGGPLLDTRTDVPAHPHLCPPTGLANTHKTKTDTERQGQTLPHRETHTATSADAPGHIDRNDQRPRSGHTGCQMNNRKRNRHMHTDAGMLTHIDGDEEEQLGHVPHPSPPGSGCPFH